MRAGATGTGAAAGALSAAATGGGGRRTGASPGSGRSPTVHAAVTAAKARASTNVLVSGPAPAKENVRKSAVRYGPAGT